MTARKGRRRIIPALAIAGAAMLAAGTEVTASTEPDGSGFDLWVTPANGMTFVEVTGTGGTVRVPLKGVRLDEPGSEIRNTDTIVERTAGPADKYVPNLREGELWIEVVALHLVSMQPIVVDNVRYDVHVVINKRGLDSLPETPDLPLSVGKMRIDEATGTWESCFGSTQNVSPDQAVCSDLGVDGPGTEGDETTRGGIYAKVLVTRVGVDPRTEVVQVVEGPEVKAIILSSMECASRSTPVTRFPAEPRPPDGGSFPPGGFFPDGPPCHTGPHYTLPVTGDGAGWTALLAAGLTAAGLVAVALARATRSPAWGRRRPAPVKGWSPVVPRRPPRRDSRRQSDPRRDLEAQPRALERIVEG